MIKFAWNITSYEMYQKVYIYLTKIYSLFSDGV